MSVDGFYYREYMVFEDWWSLVEVVSQDRFYATELYLSDLHNQFTLFRKFVKPTGTVHASYTFTCVVSHIFCLFKQNIHSADLVVVPAI